MELFSMNKAAATEWLIKAWHNLSSARILIGADHYTDVIAVDLHYSIEKILKSFLALKNEKIPRSHNLIELYAKHGGYIQLNDDDLDLLSIASEYHIKESYPSFYRKLPDINEINKVLIITERLFDESCLKHEIDKAIITKRNKI